MLYDSITQLLGSIERLKKYLMHWKHDTLSYMFLIQLLRIFCFSKNFYRKSLKIDFLGKDPNTDIISLNIVRKTAFRKAY